MPVITLKPSDEGVSGEESFNRESSPIEIIPEGVIATVEVIDVKHVKKPWTTDLGEEVWNYEFTFKIVDDGEASGRYVNQRLWADVWAEFSDDKRCKLRFWTQELLRSPIDVGFQLNTDDLIGTFAIVTIGIKTWEKQDGTTGTRNVIKWLTRVRDDDASDLVPSARSQGEPQPLPASAPGEEPF